MHHPDLYRAPVRADMDQRRREAAEFRLWRGCRPAARPRVRSRVRRALAAALLGLAARVDGHVVTLRLSDLRAEEPETRPDTPC